MTGDFELHACSVTGPPTENGFCTRWDEASELLTSSSMQVARIFIIAYFFVPKTTWGNWSRVKNEAEQLVRAQCRLGFCNDELDTEAPPQY